MLKTIRRLLVSNKLIRPTDFEAFLNEPAQKINKARLKHLDTLKLDIKNKKVLEVGAGIGLLTDFFEKKGCQILVTDSRRENVQEIKKRYPDRNVKILDLEKASDFKNIGKFQMIFCYGTLYHLSNPEKTMRLLSKICTEMILVETVLDLESDGKIRVVKEKNSVSQASHNGCRPTRDFVFKLLKKYFDYAYTTKTQPKHVDFITNWAKPPKQPFYRAIFIGSKKPIKNSRLLNYLPDKQYK